ncbi:MAG: integration host factor, actinobacterial type [Acidimicrobiia bacterium]
MPGADTSSGRRAAALEKVAEARRARARLSELLKTGDIALDGVFEVADRDPIIAGMKLRSVLSSLPRLGKVEAHRLMEEHEIAENARIRGVGSEQRSKLLDALA